MTDKSLPSIARRMRRSVNVTRVLVVGSAIAFAAIVLLGFLASLGDSDLPPYDPPFPGERFGWKVLVVLLWPLWLSSWIIGHDPATAFGWLLLFLSGLFWASLIEI